MKTKPRTLFTMLGVLGAVALGLHFGALEALGIVPSPPVTYALGDLNLQNGWDGGIVGGNPVPFTNNNPDSNVVTDTDKYSGTQSWRYGGSYGSPGAGTPFTPDVATVGALNATAAGSPFTPAGNKSVVSFAFKAVAPGDGSRINVYEGSFARDDRRGRASTSRTARPTGTPPGPSASSTSPR